MPYVQPSVADVHVDTALTNISVAFMQSDQNFVARRVFPEVIVNHKTDAYYTFDRGEWNRSQMKRRAPGAKAPVGTMKLATDNYNADVFALAKQVPDEIRANADSAIAPDREASEWLAIQALLDLEIGWATTYFTPGAPGGTWTFDVDGVASGATAPASFDPTNGSNNDKLQWNDASSTPIEDVRQGKRFVGESTGFRPNVLTLGRPVFDVLLDHPDIVGRLDRGQTGGPAIVERQNLAALFELDDVLVMDGIQNTAKENQTAAHSYIGGKHALLAYRPPTAGLQTPTAGYTFRWRGIDQSVPSGAEITRFRQTLEHSDLFEIQTAYDQKLVSKDLGYFFGAIVA